MRTAILIVHAGYSTDASNEDTCRILAQPGKYGDYSVYLRALKSFLNELRMRKKKNFFVIRDGASRILEPIFLPNDDSFMMVTVPTYEYGEMLVGARHNGHVLIGQDKVVSRLERALKGVDRVAVAGEYVWYDRGELLGSRSSECKGCLGSVVSSYFSNRPVVGISQLVYPLEKPKQMQEHEAFIQNIYDKAIPPGDLFIN